jgi:large subunit ribosomal protein L3
MVKGILGKKLGMTRIFAEDGRWIPVSVVQAGPCTVVQCKNDEADGYTSVQLGFGEKKAARATKAAQGHFKKNDLEVQRVLREFSLAGDEVPSPGDIIKVDLFEAGERVDVAGTSKGKGFAGVMKRHGFGGGPGGHGSHFHRAPGSIGQSADPAKVYKGKKMPGRMGNERVTGQNLEVVRVDTERNLLLLRGTVPGPKGGVIEIKKSVKTKRSS